MSTFPAGFKAFLKCLAFARTYPHSQFAQEFFSVCLARQESPGHTCATVVCSSLRSCCDAAAASAAVTDTLSAKRQLCCATMAAKNLGLYENTASIKMPFWCRYSNWNFEKPVEVVGWWEPQISSHCRWKTITIVWTNWERNRWALYVLRHNPPFDWGTQFYLSVALTGVVLSSEPAP